MGVGAIVKCHKCGDIIQAEYEGQFLRCRCGAIFVDPMRGGKGLTRVGGDRALYEILPGRG